MTSAISKELAIQKDYLDNELVETIYFGGGTPSLLDEKEINTIIESIANNYDVVGNPEICLEANPDDLSKDKLLQLYNSSINRLSIGVQSFDDDHLSYLNRAHNSKEAISCVKTARSVGIDNISIDLIYGIPDDDHTIWKEDLAQAAALKPTHISSYCLTIENRTVFGNWLEKNKIKPINEEFAAQQFEILLDILSANGYEQYEVSNFCLPNQYSKHNSNYWKQEKYLGVGPSAHSYNSINRQHNVVHNKKYLDALAKSNVPFTLDELDGKDHTNEYLLTTLRTKWGADLNILKDKHEHDLWAYQRNYLEDLFKKELAYLESNKLILTDKGKLFADKIASDLFLM